ncbi:hypothetical protein NOCA270013 [metagenome]|uniref:methionine synthase n=1 Tax=metagenome TaxID=256318 RepID=A0A2P2CDB6_9ZZZZ
MGGCPEARSRHQRSRIADFVAGNARCHDAGSRSSGWTACLGLSGGPDGPPLSDWIPVPETSLERPDCTVELTAALRERILVLDGAMGTAIQRDRPDEAGYRGERFADWPSDLQGNNDLLTITQPQIISAIHEEYLEAGADIIETNTFNAQAISLGDYGMADLSYELNASAARLARAACDAMTVRTPDRPRYVAGALGPTTRTASISPDVNDPGARNVSYDELVAAYLEAAGGLVDGGADLLVIETIFDTLNAKAAIFAVETLFEQRGRRWPVIVSGTITDASGRTLSGQVTEAFWDSVRHVAPLAVGLNCALGAKEMRPYIAEMSRLADTFVSCYPNAGLPNAFGEYDEAAEETAAMLGEFSTSGFTNLVGGCCGTTPDRHHPRPHSRHRRGCAGPGASRADRRRTRPAAVWTRAVHHQRHLALRQRRRAHQHHRLSPLPHVDQGRRLRHGTHRGRTAGRERRAGHRRQHGRRHDRRRRRHGPVPQAGGGRARHQPGSRDDRLLQVGGDRSRAEVRPGQVDRQLDLHEGGRGQVPRPGAAVPQVRRSRRRDGLRRGRPGRQPGPAPSHLRAGLPDPRGRGRVPARGHHLRPQRVRRRHGHRGARVLRTGLHRGHPLDQGQPAGRPRLGRHLQRVVLLPGQQPGPRGHPRRLPLPCDQGRSRHGHRERGRAGGLRRGRARAARTHRGRGAQPPRRRRRAAARDRRVLQPLRRGPRRGRGGAVAHDAPGGADHPCPGEGHRRPRGGRHRGAQAGDRSQGRAPHRGHRGPPHGRHERGRRPVRGRQDVPAPGGQERPGDEEGRRLADPVHRAGEARQPRAGHRQGHQRHDHHGHGQGRRARHRQEHRGGRAPVQQLRGHRPRGDGSCAEDPRRGAGA